MNEIVAYLINKLNERQLNWIVVEIIDAITGISHDEQPQLAADILQRIFVDSYNYWNYKNNNFSDYIDNAENIDFSNIVDNNNKVTELFNSNYSDICVAYQALVEKLNSLPSPDNEKIKNVP